MSYASEERKATFEACYGTMCGIIIREDGRSRPGTMDEIEARFGTDAVDAVMAGDCRFIDLGAEIDQDRPVTPEQYDRLIAANNAKGGRAA